MISNMKNIVYMLVAFSFAACNGQNSQINTKSKTIMSEKDKVVKTEEEWKKVLSPEQYNILREKGTEIPYTGKYYLHKEKGVYVCAACGNELFKSDTKFDAGCGWPSFSVIAATSASCHLRNSVPGIAITDSFFVTRISNPAVIYQKLKIENLP